MSLTIIDGHLCCPRAEFAFLYAIKQLVNSEIMDAQRLLAEDRALKTRGAAPRTYFTENSAGTHSAFAYLPDDWLVDRIFRCIQPIGYGYVYTQVGEEDVEGEVWPGPDADAPALDPYWTDATGEKHRIHHADLSPTGPASLGGKIVLELCRRLALEVRGDNHVKKYAAPKLPKGGIFQILREGPVESEKQDEGVTPDE